MYGPTPVRQYISWNSLAKKELAGKFGHMSEHVYRILLVEDEASLASMLKLNLEMEGYKVVLATDGMIALEKFRTQAFDLAILDVMLPELDGFAVCQTIRLEGIKTPVLFLSAKSSGRDRVEGLRIG